MALETLFSGVRLLGLLPTPRVKCLLIALVLTTFKIKSVYEECKKYIHFFTWNCIYRFKTILMN